MPFFKNKPLAGPGFIILNVLRGLNIIGLVAVIIASFAMLVKTFIVSKFFFFDAVSHVITAGLSMLLVITETSIFKSYIARNWPLLSPAHGFVTLGFLMVVVGVSVLGNLNKEATSQKSLGTAYWRIVIASGIIVVVLGVANVFASYIFRHKKLGVTARQIRAHGAVAAQKLPFPVTSPVQSLHRMDSKHRPFGLARSDTAPSYKTTGTNSPSPKGRKISAPMNDLHPNQFVRFDEGREEVAAPDLAHHPAMNQSRF